MINYCKIFADLLDIDKFNEYYNSIMIEKIGDERNKKKIDAKNYIKDKAQDYNNEDQDMEKKLLKFLLDNQ